MTRLLLSIQWRQLRNSLSNLRAGQFIPFVVLGLGALIFLPILLFSFSSLVATWPKETLTPLFSGVFLAAIAVTVLFAIPQVFKDLFSARDVEMLFTLPIPTRSIFWVKYTQSFLSTAGLIWFLLLLALIVLGVVSGAAWLYYPILVLVSLSVVVLGMALAYLFNLLLIQILPAHRAKELMTVMSGLAGFVIVILFQLPNLLGGNDSDQDVVAMLPNFPGWLPTSWGGESLTRAAQGEALSLLWAGFIVVFAVCVSVLASLLVERGFRTGWIRLSGAGHKRKKRRKTKGSLALRHPVLFLGIKEWRAIQRDPREWMMFMPLLIVMIFPLIPLLRNPEGIQFLLQYPLLSWVIAQVALIFFFSLIIGTFTASSIAREEKAVWVLRTLPLGGWQIALGKLWIHWFIPLVFIAVIEVGLGLFLGWSWLWIVAGVGTYAFLSIGMCSIGLWMGTLGAKYNPDNPQNRLETGTGFLLMILNIVYLIIITIPSLMILMPGEYAFFFTDIAAGSSGVIHWIATVVGSILTAKASQEVLIIALGVLILFGFALGVSYFLLRLSAKRIDAGIQINIVQGKSRKKLKTGSLLKR